MTELYEHYSMLIYTHIHIFYIMMIRMYLLVKSYTFGLTTGRMSLNVFYLLNHYTHAGMLHVIAVLIQ